MKVSELTQDVVGKRVRVTGVAPSESERLGYVNDTERLMGLEDTVRRFVGEVPVDLQLWVDWEVPQLWVDWDDKARGGTLALVREDEVEVLDG